MRNHMAAGWFYSPKQIVRYFATRHTSLKPPRTKLRNPIHVLGELDRHQWLMFSVGFLAWTWDAFDFISVSLCLTEIATEFNTTNSAVSWGITITLMLRSAGALISGVFSDRYGPKWVMIINLFLFIVLELATGFVQSLSQFLGVRALYGIAMGGLYGPAAATALDDLPYDARGILSGLYQQGYAVGCLLAAIFYRALVPTTAHGWRSLFWFGAGPPVLIIAFRWWLPETNAAQVMRADRESNLAQKQGSDISAMTSSTAWLRDVRTSLKENWVLFIYMIVLMTGFNSCTHGAQDMYPTFLKNQVELGPTDVTIISVVSQIGAIVGGTTVGYVSTFAGRRLSMMICCILGIAVLPAYVLPRSMSLAAGAFFLFFCTGGAGGPIPIHLSELSPPALRTTAFGLTYQLGNLASSATTTIQATIGERFPLPPKDGVSRYDYGKVIWIFVVAVWIYILIFLFLGPEMTQEERAEHAAAADQIEKMRKDGVSLAEIGAQRAKLAALDDESSRFTHSEKPSDIEHVE
ncbi:carboxylic acid transporter [Xylaria cf. heliscus]|nr:carboxylic acid transporter [Xylaria cf. heliscus]